MLALALVPVVEAVPLVVAPAAVDPDVPAVVSMRALLRMNPLPSRARQPVTVTLFALSVVLLVRWLVVVVLVCAPSVTAHATAAAIPRPVAVRFILAVLLC
jgi:hypothetical protein